MGQYGKLIFVSGDDTALGPMAEAIMQSRILLGDMDITSRGVVVLFPEPINPKAEAVLVSNGLTMKDHMSAPLLRSDFAEGTLILATSEDVRQKVLREFAPDEVAVYALPDYVGASREAINPYGGALADYGRCFAELEVLIDALVNKLNEEELSW